MKEAAEFSVKEGFHGMEKGDTLVADKDGDHMKHFILNFNV
jgi:hypothetical protein